MQAPADRGHPGEPVHVGNRLRIKRMCQRFSSPVLSGGSAAGILPLRRSHRREIARSGSGRVLRSARDRRPNRRVGRPAPSMHLPQEQVNNRSTHPTGHASRPLFSGIGGNCRRAEPGPMVLVGRSGTTGPPAGELASPRGDRLDPVEGRDDRARGNWRASIGEVIDPRVVHSVGAWFADAVVRLGGRRRRYAAGAGQELLERAHRIIDL